MLKEILIPKKGKDSSIIRFYLVLIYILLVVGIFWIFIYHWKHATYQWKLYPDDVRREFNLTAYELNPSLETLQLISESNILSDTIIARYENKSFYGYGYKIYLREELNNLSLKTSSELIKSELLNYNKVFENRVDKYIEMRIDNFGFKNYIIPESLIWIAFIIPLSFILLRSIFYHIVFYIAFGKNKK